MSVNNHHLRVRWHTTSSYRNVHQLLSNTAEDGFYLICPPAFVDFFQQMKREIMSSSHTLIRLTNFLYCGQIFFIPKARILDVRGEWGEWRVPAKSEIRTAALPRRVRRTGAASSTGSRAQFSCLCKQGPPKGSGSGGLLRPHLLLRQPPQGPQEAGLVGLILALPSRLPPPPHLNSQSMAHHH